MKYFLAIFCVAVAGLSFGQTNAAPPAPASAQKAEVKPGEKSTNDFSDQPFVVESIKSTVRFEADGTGVRSSETRVHLQSESAVQQLGQLVFSYNSEFEKLTISGRVEKADGTSIPIPDSAIQDVSSPVSRVAPMYSDQRQKHVIVPSLRPGDTLEYETKIDQFAPMAPNQFWLSYDFDRKYIVRDEELTVDVPASKYVNVKSADEFKPVVSEKNGRRIYSWKTSHLERPDDSAGKDKGKKKKHGEDKFPDVQVSTFKTWGEVGNWYATLEKDRTTPSDAIRAKAADLTSGLSNEMDKLQAIYTYVSENYRYVSLSFGAGRFQPHAASEVFVNEYGDCKDKHTLLAAMADAIGLHAYAALTSSTHKVDASFPSPAQFNHVITYIPVGKDTVWLDTTADLAPFRLLLPTVRGKSALVVGVAGESEIKEVPKAPAVPNVAQIDLTGTINELGTLDADVRMTFRGDSEVLTRLSVRAVPEAKWKDYIEYLAKSAGIEGEASNVKFSDFLDLKKPMEYSFHINKLNYFNRFAGEPKLQLPMGQMEFKSPEESEDGKPIDLSMVRLDYDVKLTFPKQFSIQLPLPVKLDREFGHYESKYSLAGQTITARRTLELTAAEIPADDYGQLQAFRRIVSTDSRQELSITVAKTADSEVASDISPEELLKSAESALRNGDYQAAIDLLNQVIKKQPKHKTAYETLGRAYRALGNDAEAEAAFKKAVEMDPYSPYAYNYLGLTYWKEHLYEAAAAQFQKQLEVDPLDKWAHYYLGEMLNEQKKFADAEAELEKANSITPNSAGVLIALGKANLGLGNSEKAQMYFSKAVSLAPNPSTWNDVAYDLADQKGNLDLAKQYAESAVSSVAAALRNVRLSDLKIQQLAAVNFLAMCWDTLGWVHFQKGDVPVAEKYLTAAWDMSQQATVADHLGQLYEKKGDRDKAIEYYSLSLASDHPDPETRSRLAKLVGDKKVNKLVDRQHDALTKARTFDLPNAKGEGSADFYIALAPGPKVEDVRYIGGNDRLKDLGDLLKQVDFKAEFPDQTDTRIVRRGVLSCAASANSPIKKDKQTEPPGNGPCKFVLLTPESLRTVN